MKPSIKINADAVIKNFKRSLDLSKDLRPVFLQILGKDGDSRQWTVKGGVARSFASKTSPDGESWSSLSAKYFKQKMKKFPGMPTLVAKGNLFNSLVNRNNFTVGPIMTARSMIYGTFAPYAKYHQSRGPRGKLPRRAFMGVTDIQIQAWKKLIKSGLTAALHGDVFRGEE